MRVRMYEDGSDGFFIDCLADKSPGTVIGLVYGYYGLATNVRRADGSFQEADLGFTALAMAAAGF